MVYKSSDPYPVFLQCQIRIVPLKSYQTFFLFIFIDRIRYETYSKYVFFFNKLLLKYRQGCIRIQLISTRIRNYNHNASPRSLVFSDYYKKMDQTFWTYSIDIPRAAAMSGCPLLLTTSPAIHPLFIYFTVLWIRSRILVRIRRDLAPDLNPS